MASRYPAKPPLNAWVQSQRKLKGWKVEELSARLTDLGHEAKPDTIRVWEGNKPNPPRPETIRALEVLFGSEAPLDDTSDSDVAAAIRAQTEVMRDLVAELRASRLAASPEATRQGMAMLFDELMDRGWLHVPEGLTNQADTPRRRRRAKVSA